MTKTKWVLKLWDGPVYRLGFFDESDYGRVLSRDEAQERIRRSYEEEGFEVATINYASCGFSITGRCHDDPPGMSEFHRVPLNIPESGLRLPGP